jgi:hypothetical protein
MLLLVLTERRRSGRGGEKRGGVRGVSRAFRQGRIFGESRFVGACFVIFGGFLGVLFYLIGFGVCFYLINGEEM